MRMHKWTARNCSEWGSIMIQVECRNAAAWFRWHWLHKFFCINVFGIMNAAAWNIRECGSISGLWGCVHCAHLMGTGWWGRKNVLHDQWSLWNFPWRGSCSPTCPVLFEVLVLVLVEESMRTCKVYVWYDCTQRNDKDLTLLVETDGNIECNYNRKKLKIIDRFIILKRLACRHHLQSTEVNWNLNKIYCSCSHRFTKDWHWNISSCSPKYVWVLSRSLRRMRKLTVIARWFMTFHVAMNNRIYRFCHCWGTHLRCIVHSRSLFLDCWLSSIRNEKIRCCIDRLCLWGLCIIDWMFAVPYKQLAPKNSQCHSQVQVMAVSLADASVWSRMKHRFAILRPKWKV